MHKVRTCHSYTLRKQDKLLLQRQVWRVCKIVQSENNDGKVMFELDLYRQQQQQLSMSLMRIRFMKWCTDAVVAFRFHQVCNRNKFQTHVLKFDAISRTNFHEKESPWCSTPHSDKPH